MQFSLASICIFATASALLVALTLSSPPPLFVVVALVASVYICFFLVPNDRVSRTARTFIVISFFLVLAYAAQMIRPPRPMFANEYGYHPDGRPPWPRWWVVPPHCDETGKIVIADYGLNLLVIFLTDDFDVSPGFPVIGDGGVYFMGTRGGQQIRFDVPLVKDRILLFHRDGSRQDFQLLAHEAKRIYSQLETAYDDLVPVLLRLYKEKHTEQLIRPDAETPVSRSGRKQLRSRQNQAMQPSGKTHVENGRSTPRRLILAVLSLGCRTPRNGTLATLDRLVKMGQSGSLPNREVFRWTRTLHFRRT